MASAAQVSVAGHASLNFDGAIIINGNAASTSVGSDGITYSATVLINNIDANIIEVQASGTDGSSAVVRQTVYGYETVAARSYWEENYGHSDAGCWYLYSFPDDDPYYGHAVSEEVMPSPGSPITGAYTSEGYDVYGNQTWTWTDSWTDPEWGSWTNGDRALAWFGGWRSDELTDGKHLDSNNSLFKNCPHDQACAGYADRDCCLDTTEPWYVTDREDDLLTFIKHWPVDEEQTVVLHFHRMCYDSGGLTDFADEANQITLWGQTGFVYAVTAPNKPVDVGFAVKIRTNTRYTIRESDFTFPSYRDVFGCTGALYSWSNPQTWFYSVFFTHELQTGGFANDVVLLSSARATKSPVTFEFGKTDISDPCAVPNARALVVYYEDVVNQDFEVQPFDVKLQIFPGNTATGVQWSKHSGPDSGTLKDATKATATFSNPAKGGLYQFDLGYLNHTTRTQLLVPLAGPEIEDWVSNEIQYLNTWAANYLANAGWTRKVPFLGKYLRADDLYRFGMTLDWTNHFTSANGPCWPGGPEFEFNPRHTINGIVVDRFHPSNLLVAYLARAMTGWTEQDLIDVFNRVATPDDQYDVESYRIGFAVYSGETLEEAMQAHGHKQQKPRSWDVKLWPNEETPTGGSIVRPPALN